LQGSTICLPTGSLQKYKLVLIYQKGVNHEEIAGLIHVSQFYTRAIQDLIKKLPTYW